MRCSGGGAGEGDGVAAAALAMGDGEEADGLTRAAGCVPHDTSSWATMTPAASLTKTA
jgi:hypothetical protein